MAGVRSRAVGKPIDAVIGEHLRLRALRRDVAGLLAGRGGVAWARRVDDKLHELLLRLDEHFTLEERAGLFEHIETALPQASHESGRLRADHGALLTRLERLREEVQELSHPGALLRFKESVAWFLRDLARHEETENALLIRAAEGDEAEGLD